MEPKAEGNSRQINGDVGFDQPRRHTYYSPSSSENSMQYNGNIERSGVKGFFAEVFSSKVSGSRVNAHH